MSIDQQNSQQGIRQDSLPEEGLQSHVRQKISEGVGPIYHRVYSIALPVPFERARAAMRDLHSDPDRFSPQLLATFEKKSGEPTALQAGDEFQIHITGPWNGPVRVADVAPDSFRLLTLEGHLEAGEIRFRVKENGEKGSLFEIESLARSRDAIVDFVYDKLPIAKLAQTEMWSCFCKSFAEHALGGTPVKSDVEILTERQDEESGVWEKI